MDGFRKFDPPKKKMAAVSVDLPEYVCNMGREFAAMAVDLAAGDLCLLAFYFLLRAGEYVKKASQEESKQTVQFRLRDVAFFEATDDGMVR